MIKNFSKLFLILILFFFVLGFNSVWADVADTSVEIIEEEEEEEEAPAPGGGGLPSAAYNPPTPPSPTPESPKGGFKVLINNDDEYTKEREVSLKLFAGKDTEKMAISNNSVFSGLGTGQISFESPYTWDLCYQQKECPDGVYTVYAKFYTQYGQASEVVSDTITLRKKKPLIEKIPEVIEEIIEEVEEIIEKFAELFKPEPEPEEKPELPLVEEVVPKEAPLVFQGKWQLLAREPIKRFVLAPLPKEIQVLAEKFPELEKTFEQVGITKITDIKKLRAVKLTLPAIKEKEALPTDIVFAKTGAERIDLPITLSLDEKGKPEQRIQTISNKPLQLAVKPDKPVESVKGYVVFKSKVQSSKSKVELPLNSLLASVFLAPPSFAQTHNPAEIETRLVLLEFEYTDPDNDGIYTAEINAPIVEGEYEIITVMDFEDPELGQKEIRLITVVDPEGYVYRVEPDGIKARIPGATVSLYWLNPATKQYYLWPAKEYQQENPQITDDTGKYSFLVPEGTYYLKVEAPSYLAYEGESFEVKEGGGIHKNIELKSKQWWLRVLSWEKILLIFLTIIVFTLAFLLFYNFYRDKIRERI